MFKNILKKLPYKRWSDLDKVALRRQLLRDEYGENANVLDRAVKAAEAQQLTHSFPQLLNKKHIVAVISTQPYATIGGDDHRAS